MYECDSVLKYYIQAVNIVSPFVCYLQYVSPTGRRTIQKVCDRTLLETGSDPDYTYFFRERTARPV